MEKLKDKTDFMPAQFSLLAIGKTGHVFTFKQVGAGIRAIEKADNIEKA